jgi:hypothetical protein
MHWLSPTSGFVAGDNGVILKVSLNDVGASFELQDSGTSYEITKIEFADTKFGVASTSRTVLLTRDGGDTWVESKINGITDATITGTGRVWAMTWERNLILDGLNGDQVLEGSSVWTRGRRTFVDGRNGFYYTDDDANFTEMSRNLRTPTQIIRDADPDEFVYVNESTWFYQASGGWCLTENSGASWTDPMPRDRWDGALYKARSKNVIWGLSSPTLYKHRRS